jgi:hypothetical protein
MEQWFSSSRNSHGCVGAAGDEQALAVDIEFSHDFVKQHVLRPTANFSRDETRFAKHVEIVNLDEKMAFAARAALVAIVFLHGREYCEEDGYGQTNRPTAARLTARKTIVGRRMPVRRCTVIGTAAGSLRGSSQMTRAGLGGAKMSPLRGDNARDLSAARSAENTRGLRKLSTARALRRPRGLPFVFSASSRNGDARAKTHVRPLALSRMVPRDTHGMAAKRDVLHRHKNPALAASGLTPDNSSTALDAHSIDFQSLRPSKCATEACSEGVHGCVERCDRSGLVWVTDRLQRKVTVVIKERFDQCSRKAFLAREEHGLDRA